MRVERDESKHWTRTERVPGHVAAAIGSRDVRLALLQAEYRERHPGWRDRILVRIRKLRLVFWPEAETRLDPED